MSASMYYNVLFRLMGLDGEIMLRPNGVRKKAVAMCVIALPEKDYLFNPQSIFSALSIAYKIALDFVRDDGPSMYAEEGVLDARFVDAVVDEFVRSVVSEERWQAVKVEESINLRVPSEFVLVEEAYE